MLAPVTLILGGARSGKSRYAQTLAESQPGPCVYLATAEVRDDEMADRVDSHQRDRGTRWTTHEEPVDLITALRSAATPDGVVLVDCLTLWLSNLMERDRDIANEAAALMDALPGLGGPVIFVSNEVGQGIVPDNALARRFRDEAGRLHQAVAAAAQRVDFVAAGLPLTLKDTTGVGARGTRSLNLFDGYLMVDWSAAAMPRTGADSIWYALVERDKGLVDIDNPPTRAAALQAIRAICRDYARSGRRLLAGFDFPNGYPHGTAARVGLDGIPWRALWDHLAAATEEGEKNANNRFAVAADLNRRMSGGPFPFWGCPAGAAGVTLGQKKTRDFRDDGVPEFRLVERTAKGAKSCWQLLGAGSVGGQVLTGIPVQHALRSDPDFGDAVTVWPFETGLREPDIDGAWRIVIAEIYPSLFPVTVHGDAVKDAVQVETVARALADWDGDGTLSRHFAGPVTLTDGERWIIEREEGWILGAGTMAL